jgi:hypothetical protein
MISGKKLMKIGWYMLSVPFILMMLVILVSYLVSKKPYSGSVIANIIVAFLAAIMVLSILPIVAGATKTIVENIAGKGKDAKTRET